MTRRLTPRPTSQPFGELIVVGAASIALGLVACASSSSSYGPPPTCGPCCHGSHGPECGPRAASPDEMQADVSTTDAASTESTVDANTADASTFATDAPLGQSAGDPPPARDAGATRDAGTTGRRRGTNVNPPLGGSDRGEVPNGAPTCGPRCHNPGGADGDPATPQ